MSLVQIPRWVHGKYHCTLNQSYPPMDSTCSYHWHKSYITFEKAGWVTHSAPLAVVVSVQVNTIAQNSLPTILSPQSVIAPGVLR